MTAQAGTAGRRGYDHASLNEGFEESAAECVEVDLLGSRNNNGADALCNVLALYHSGSSLQVGVSAVST